MSAEILRRAAKGIGDEWADAEPHIKPTAFYLAVGRWLESEIFRAECRERQQREINAGLQADLAPYPCYYDTQTALAIAAARAYLGES